jgi:hypothetical protein
MTMRPPNAAKSEVRSAMEGGFKRLGALFLKVMAVPMVPIGLGFMLYGLFQILHADGADSISSFLPLASPRPFSAAYSGYWPKSSMQPRTWSATDVNKIA